MPSTITEPMVRPGAETLPDGLGRRPPARPLTDILLDSDTCTPIAEAEYRTRVRVKGQVRSLRVRPWGEVPSLELVLVDGTGGITVVFLGRRHVAGIRPGSLLVVEGMVGAHHRRLAVLNPRYDLRHFSL